MGGGTQLKPYLDIVYRRRWWVVVPLVLGLVGGVVVLSQMKKIYQAQVRISVREQEVPDDFVRSTVTSGVQVNAESLMTEILTPTYLDTVAREFQYVPPDPTPEQLQSARFRLMRRIQFNPDIESRIPQWFDILVDGVDPVKTAAIANRLAGIFVEQNSLSRTSEAAKTLETARAILTETKAKLDQREAQLAAYKQGRLWELPERLDTNMTLLQNTQQQIHSIDEQIADRRNEIALLRIQAQQVVPMPGGPVVTSVDPARAQLAQLQAELRQLELVKTEEHPDVRRKKSEIAAFVQQNPHLQKPEAPPGTPASATTTAGPSLIDAEIDRVENEIARLQADQSRLIGLSGTYHARIGTAPTREQEMEALTRDLELLREQHKQWIDKETVARRAFELERAQRGDRFQIRVPATPPNTPYKPNPWQVILVGLLGGLGLGVGVTFVLEFFDNTIRTEEQFTGAFPDLPLLAAIPDLDRVSTERVKRRRTHSRAAALSIMASALALATTSAAWLI